MAGFEPAWTEAQRILSHKSAANLLNNLLNTFMSSRRDGLSTETLKFYRGYLNRSQSVIGTGVTGQQVKQFIDSRKCNPGGKHAYYRVLRVFYNWLYSPRSGYGLNPQDNPILMVESPKVGRRILPSLTPEQIVSLIDRSESVRDKAIISLFSDSGLRLSELTSVRLENIDWGSRLIKVLCRGNKEGLAPFGEGTESLLREWLSQYSPNGGNIWGIDKWDIVDMLRGLRSKTGLPCNPHTFRRTLACLLRKAGLDTMTIKDLGRRESLEMVQRYTRSVTFQDSMKFLGRYLVEYACY